MKEFLNAKSMLTPGVAGLVAMLITNALHAQFAMPSRWIALVLSFLIGSLVFSDTATRLLQRVVLYVINSLIIFSIAVGANTAGAAATKPQGQGMFPPAAQERPFFSEWFPSE
ncbi:MAG TPA: hypothetical protein VJZ76_03510 [Thermoanaerobaculia bacterium]|nr:hypothetical protein [Thermoanaerobaculia bacterium]